MILKQGSKLHRNTEHLLSFKMIFFLYLWVVSSQFPRLYHSVCMREKQSHVNPKVVVFFYVNSAFKKRFSAKSTARDLIFTLKAVQ